MNAEAEVFDNYERRLTIRRDGDGCYLEAGLGGYLFDAGKREELIRALIATRPSSDVTVADQREDLALVALHASEYAPGEGLQRRVRSALMSAADAYAQVAATAGCPVLSPLTATPGVACDEPMQDGDAEDDPVEPCGKPSRFAVTRSDGDAGYGYSPDLGAGFEEACEDHLPGVIAGMVNGDEGVSAVVTIRWDAAAADGES